MRTMLSYAAVAACVLAFLGCEDIDTGKGLTEQTASLDLAEVARILSELPIEGDQLGEVHDAVGSSSDNGYDDEYTMRDLFASPGKGVGDTPSKAATKAYYRPMRELLKDYFREKSSTKATDDFSPEDYISTLESSDMQIYWPYHEDWDGEEYPIITFDPDDGSVANTGYKLEIAPDGSRSVKEVVVSEQVAMKHPVWVVNRNDDSGYSSLEMLRRQDPSWGEGGGSVVIGRKASSKGTKAGSESFKTLILRDFTMQRNFDSWFAGASEFFVKCGAVEDFSASTEAELKLYTPLVTDFMIVVKRSFVGKPRPFNAVIVSGLSEQVESCAFMITEDDGGTRTTWNCEAKVMVKSKSYGFDISMPFNTRDDIVWRGSLMQKYLLKYNGQTCSFGDVDLRFELVDL